MGDGVVSSSWLWESVVNTLSAFLVGLIPIKEREQNGSCGVFIVSMEECCCGPDVFEENHPSTRTLLLMRLKYTTQYKSVYFNEIVFLIRRQESFRAALPLSAPVLANPHCPSGTTRSPLPHHGQRLGVPVLGSCLCLCRGVAWWFTPIECVLATFPTTTGGAALVAAPPSLSNNLTF